MAHPTWPLYDIVIRTPKVELRLPNEAEYVELMTQADERIYERTGFLPFHTPWPGDGIAAMKFMYGTRANWQPDDWHLTLCTFVDGRIVGSQGLVAKDFGVVRGVSTGSWLLPDVQGRGIGREMRTAVLHFAFAGLGAVEAHSQAHVDNHASNRVSEALGYEVTHHEGARFGDVRAESYKLVLRREVWEQHPIHRRDDIVFEGLDDTIDWFVAGA